MPAFTKIISAFLIAIGIAGAGWLVGQSLVESRQPLRTVTVKGLSEKYVSANLGFWPIKFVATGATLEDARKSLETSEKNIRNVLTTAGFSDADMNVQNIMVEDRLAGYNAANTPDAARFVLTEEFLLTSENVEALSLAARNMGEFIRRGVVFSSDSYNSGPSFSFTDINNLKSEMLAEATQRARESAEQFAKEANTTVATIQTANQGVFEILAAVEIPDQRAEKQIEKKVRVVTTITYFLK